MDLKRAENNKLLKQQQLNRSCMQEGTRIEAFRSKNNFKTCGKINEGIILQNDIIHPSNFLEVHKKFCRKFIKINLKFS